MRAYLLSSLLVAVALAGCTESAPGNGDISDITSEEIAGLDAPTWAIGDWWTYAGPNNEFNLVVSEDAGSAWIIDTDDTDLAYFHAAFGPISYLGEQRKTDLAGSQGSDDVEFFAFPLEDGKTWQTNWDGESLNLVATDVGNDRFHIQAMRGEAVVTEYQYSAATKWFDWISFTDGAGTEVFRMDLVASGNSFTGEMVRVDPEVIVAETAVGPQASTANLNIPATTDGDLYLQYGIQCLSVAESAGHAYFFAMGPMESVGAAFAPGVTGQDEDGFSDAGTCPANISFAGVIGAQPNEGNWAYGIEMPPDSVYTYTLTLRHFERITL